jgi:ribosomal-protein-serine acetyltransferase
MAWLHSVIPTRIECEELAIRKYIPEDAAALVDAVTESLDELLPWMPWAKFEPQTASQREVLISTWDDEWAQCSNFTMGIFHNDLCVGGTGLHLRGEDGTLEIGYWVRSSHVGRGIARRASSALTTLAFSLPEVSVVHIAHDTANERSQRVPESLGFRVLREYERTPEAASEVGRVRLWAISREEWTERKKLAR